ncbi:ABC transporter ATP-binding protein [Dyadobacter sp. 32]|uniref:ABC transporter ATP-binding protein n=1 Tax=Dyadobacter sp. 32 TaxID=538966 RepID=UPI0011F01104
MIIAQNLQKNFNGTEAVKNISFEVTKGETLVLLGTSGCGKTTTLKMLNRLIDPTAGEIFIDGKNINTSAPEILRRHIGYVSQNNGLFPHYTVAENIAIVPRLLSWEKGKIASHSAAILDQIRLPFNSYAHKYPDELSGGEKQRVALARAMIADPKVLLMDEPFGALDPVTRVQIRKEFKELTEADKKTIVLVTHDVQEAFELGHQICLMDKGQIVQMGTAKDLIFNPSNDFVTNFFGHQRLQLELSSLTFADIWDQLAGLEASSPADVNSSCNLWEAMEWLSAANKEYVVVEQGGELKKASFSAIHSTYSRIKHKA